MGNLNPWPYVAALLVGVMLGMAGGGFGYRQFIEPQNIETAVAAETELQQQICLSDTALAAGAGQEARRLRESRAADSAIEALRKTFTAREAARVAEIDKLQQGKSDYERKLAEGNRRCPVALDDIERVRRVAP